MQRKTLTWSIGFFHRQFSSTPKILYANFIPEPSRAAKIVIPVSMTRYEKNRNQFDAELSALFQYTAKQLTENEIESVDVIATTGLHEDWSEDKKTEIDNHFTKTHKKELEQQTNFFLWKEWIDKSDRELHQKHYEEVVELSKEGSEWHKLMVKTHSNASVSKSLDVSLRYQRQEYAAIRRMTQYTDLVYMGPISPAWSFLYELYPNLPRFIRASINSQVSQLKGFDGSNSVKMILTLIEQTVASPNFPLSEKAKLKEHCNTLFRTHIPELSISNTIHPEKLQLANKALKMR